MFWKMTGVNPAGILRSVYVLVFYYTASPEINHMHRAEKLLLLVAGSNFLFRIYGIDSFIYFLTRGIFHFCCGNLG